MQNDNSEALPDAGSHVEHLPNSSPILNDIRSETERLLSSQNYTCEDEITANNPRVSQIPVLNTSLTLTNLVNANQNSIPVEPVQQNRSTNSSIGYCATAILRTVESAEAIQITPFAFTPQVQHEPPPLIGAPPTYSAIMQIGSYSDTWTCQGRIPVCIQPSPPFIAPPPPPTYAESQGYQIQGQLIITPVEPVAMGPEPITVVCPRCTQVIVTAIQSRRSNVTHFSAIVLCLCGCWPCCVLPYCLDSCKNIYHYCPNCQLYLGMYRPW